MKIVVLAGGRSTERNVSLSSGSKVANALRRKGHQVALVDLFLGVDVQSNADIAGLFTDQQVEASYKISDAVLTDADINALRTDGSTELFGPNVLTILQTADIVYLGLHGEDGENGKVQAVLDLFNIRYTGSAPLNSGMAMNKKVSKEIMMFNQIQTAAFVLVKAGQPMPTKLPFDYPVVVKPSNGGSSIGTHIAHTLNELHTAIEDAFRFDDGALIEEFIQGREFSLGIVNGQAMPAIEICVNDGWYDFEHKFQDNKTTFMTPPDIPEQIHENMKAIAVKTFDALGMINYGRVDFLWNRKDGLYVIEANSLPGMTPLSLLPQEAAAVGISYEDLCEKIVLGKWDWYNKHA